MFVGSIVSSVIGPLINVQSYARDVYT